jgi:multiple sugar transport system substrate-binding protein
MRSARRTLSTAVALATIAAFAAACSDDGGDGGGDGGGGGGDGDTLSVWIIEDLPDRVAATQAIVDDFTAASGVDVKLTPIAEDQFNQVLTSSAAAGELPDVIGALPLSQVRTLSANGLVDSEAVGEVVDDLDAGSFSESALALTAEGDEQLAVPSESWVQILVYRKDPSTRPGWPRPRRTTTSSPPPRRSTAPTWPASSAPTWTATPSPRRPSRRSVWAMTASSSTTRVR